MFYSKRLGKKTNALQILSDLMHILKRITLFLTKIYKVSNNMSPTIFNDSFASRDAPYNLRNPGSFKTQKVYSVYNGII